MKKTTLLILPLLVLTACGSNAKPVIHQNPSPSTSISPKPSSSPSIVKSANPSPIKSANQTQIPQGLKEEPIVSYKNCQEVKDAGKAPLHKGDPGWSGRLDRDHDGIACED